MKQKTMLMPTDSRRGLFIKPRYKKNQWPRFHLQDGTEYFPKSRDGGLAFNKNHKLRVARHGV